MGYIESLFIVAWIREAWIQKDISACIRDMFPIKKILVFFQTNCPPQPDLFLIHLKQIVETEKSPKLYLSFEPKGLLHFNSKELGCLIFRSVHYNKKYSRFLKQRKKKGTYWNAIIWIVKNYFNECRHYLMASTFLVEVESKRKIKKNTSQNNNKKIGACRQRSESETQLINDLLHNFGSISHSKHQKNDIKRAKWISHTWRRAWRSSLRRFWKRSLRTKRIAAVFEFTKKSRIKIVNIVQICVIPTVK